MAAKKITLDLGDDGDLSINTDYAQNYERWRRKEELQKRTFFRCKFILWRAALFQLKTSMAIMPTHTTLMKARAVKKLSYVLIYC